MATETSALVSYCPTTAPDWKFENVKVVRKPGEKELEVRMVASGICHSDVVMASYSFGPWAQTYPRVMGHEGAGVVTAVGPGVTAAKVGDPVLMSYDYCRSCDLCNSDSNAYCLSWGEINALGQKGIFENPRGEDTGGKLFGQSSFAGVSIVNEGSVVNVKEQLQSLDDLKLWAPLGCGLMTGSGAVINAAQAKPHDIVLVTGLGAVGLAAIMAAKVVGCREIIAVDRVPHRLALAQELGATKLLNTTTSSGDDLAGELRKLVDGQRISIAVETTGAVPVISASLKALGKYGRLLLIGVPGLQAELTVGLAELFGENKIIECHYLGNTTGQKWIPVMLQWWKEGKFPIEKLVKYFPAKDALDAISGMLDGSAIKPVLVW